MKSLYFSFFFLVSLASNANERVIKAYEDFYNHSSISSNHCGKNIQYFLKYLEQKQTPFRSGFVVSLHENLGALNHFDARWGRKERYASGEEYVRSNWNFHVFLVIDDLVFDFSQSDSKVQSIKDYIETAYFPKSETENIIFLGRFTRQKAIEKIVNLEMKIYSLKSYKEKRGPAAYAGTFIELFYFSNKKVLKSQKKIFEKFKFIYDQAKKNSDGTFSFLNPRIFSNGNTYPVLADSAKACRALGFLGSIPSKLKFTVSDSKKMYSVSSSFKTDSPLKLSSEAITVSLSIQETVGGVPNQPLLHYLKELTCTDLYTFLSYYYKR